MRFTAGVAGAWLVLGIAIAIAVLVGWSSDARSHTAIAGWNYGLECCSGVDCYQTAAEDVRTVKGGWVIVATGEFITFRDRRVKESQDSFFHRCSGQGKITEKTICLYVPMGGV
jgi:hypothetical protein